MNSSTFESLFSIALLVAASWTCLEVVASNPKRRGVEPGTKLKCISPVICVLFMIQAAFEHLRLRRVPNHGNSTQSVGLHNATLKYTDRQSFIMCSILVWGILSVLVFEAKTVPFTGLITTLSIAAVADITHIYYTRPAVDTIWHTVHPAIYFARVVVLTITVVCLLLTLLKGYAVSGSSEQSSLLQEPDNTPVYSALRNTEEGQDEEEEDEEDGDEDEDEEMEELKQLRENRLLEQGGWIGYLGGFTAFLPYILPFKDRATQFWYMVMLLCLAAQRVLTLLVPRQLAILIQSLTVAASTGSLPWKELVFWAFLQFPINATVDVLSSAANTRIDQFSNYQLRSVAFSHVMNLSMDYHTSKSTGKIVRAIEQGSNLASLIDMVITAGCMLLDLVIAVIYLTRTFDLSLGYIVLITSLLSIYLSVKGNSVTSGILRKVADKSREENTVLYDSITNWYTVALHNRSKYETGRYLNVVKTSMLTMRKYLDWSNVIHGSDKAVLNIGLFVAGYIAATRVVDGHASVGDFIFLVTYWESVTGPISAIAWMYHNALETLINAEWLYQLIQTKPSVQDKPNATPIDITAGRVEFHNVHFSYDAERPILQDISFIAEPGQSIALVGETGSGKTTLLKLLWRFYDPSSGSVTIDGQDLRDVTLDSLRDCLGAVPQDPSVFDVTIMENLLYARAGATEHDVYAACKAARIHDQIMSFPDRYHSKIGERGVRLSGGELQRLAIARVILRSPKIVMLDEATSAVDSDTEASVQAAIKALSANRTVFTIAHRLSTIINADKILVVDNGRIVETGTHHQLLSQEGKYARLWNMQTGKTE